MGAVTQLMNKHNVRIRRGRTEIHRCTPEVTVASSDDSPSSTTVWVRHITFPVHELSALD